MTETLPADPTIAITEARFTSLTTVWTVWRVETPTPGPAPLTTPGSPPELDHTPHPDPATLGVEILLSSDTCDNHDPESKQYLDLNKTNYLFGGVVPGKTFTFCIKLTNKAGYGERSWIQKKVTGEVHVPPTITKFPKRRKIFYTSHDVIHEECRATGVPNPRIEWWRGNRLVSSNGTLLLEEPGEEEQGAYTCVAYNLQSSRAMSPNVLLIQAVLGEFSPNEVTRYRSVPRDSGVLLECLAPPSVPEPAIKWAKLNTEHDPQPRIVTLDNRVRQTLNGHLYFTFTTAGDAGLYQCEVTNHHLETSVSGSLVNLHISGTDHPESNRAPSLLKGSPPSMSVVAGNDVTVTCAFSGKPSPRTIWYRNGNEVVPDMRHSMTSYNQTLKIRRVQPTDPTSFECQAENEAGKSYKKSTHLLILETPRWTKKPLSRNVTVGDTVTFTCQAEGSPRPRIQWYIDDQLRTNDNLLFWQELSEDNTKFTLHNVTQDYVMNFQCNATNHHDYIISDVYMNVLLPTRIVASPPERVVVMPGAVVYLPCRAETDPSTELKVTWTLNGRPLTPGPHHTLLKHGTLKLRAGDVTDDVSAVAGEYACVAGNDVSSDVATVNVTYTVENTPWSSPVLSGTENFSQGTILWVGLTGSVVFVILVCVAAFGLVRRRIRMRIPRSNTNTSIMTNLSRLSKQEEAEKAVLVPEYQGAVGGIGGVGGMWGAGGLCRVGDEHLQSAVTEVLVGRERLDLGDMVGKGQFGRVYMGVLRDERGKLRERVAVKTLKYKAEETDMVELFLKEAVLMKDFNHQHVLGLIGIAFEQDGSPMVVLPFMSNGDLRQYILNPELDITVLQLLRMGLQVAKGMVYLTERRFVHRDLAARNCMVDEKGIVKVADFGLSRELFKRDYYRVEDGKTPLPIRWMAPECLESSVFTSHSDVWAFGILLWELMTRGAVPYPEVDNWDITCHVLGGKRLGQPVYCPDSVFEIMKRCWLLEPSLRPSFDTLCRDIDRVIMAARPGSTSSYRLYINVGASKANPDYRQTTV